MDGMKSIAVFLEAAMSGAQDEGGVVREMECSTFRRAVGLDLHDRALPSFP